MGYKTTPAGLYLAKAGDSLTGALNEAKGANIASAATTNIGAATGNTIHITGTTPITALGTIQAGTERKVVFDDVLILTHNATSLILPGGANITTIAGDAAVFVSEGSGNWKCVSYQRSIVPLLARETMSDANKTFSAGKTQVALTSVLTAPRTLTLPAASAFTAGTELIFDDEIGGVSTTNTVTIARVGADTINGSTSEIINAPFGQRRFFSDGVSKWAFDAGVIRAADIRAGFFSLSFRSAALSPADSTTYYFGDGQITPSITDTSHDYALGYAFTIVGAVVIAIGNSTAGTAEQSTLKIRNVTTATSSSVGNFVTNAGSTFSVFEKFTGLNIAVGENDGFAMQVDCPAWATNPVGVRYVVVLQCKKT
ncbi:MAG: hypothetical protein M3R27_05855 [Bacteroidota bacterium]|nr:hypothetical protein [Bacteroidota bacterium]